MKKKEIDYSTLDFIGIEPKEFKLHRANYLANLKAKFSQFEENSVLMLVAGDEPLKYETDIEQQYFLQEPNFYYLTGCREYKYFAMIDFLNDMEVTLFVPTPTEREKIYTHQMSLEDVRKKYECKAEPQEQVSEKVNERNPTKIYILSGINSDSNRPITSFTYEFIEPYKDLNNRRDFNTLIYEILADTRTVKTEYEINMYRWFVNETVNAHVYAIKNIKVGLIERDVEGLFWEYASTNIKCRNHPYEHICGSGANAAILHYPYNDKPLKDGDVILMDMGAKLCEYCSDLTTTVPINGKFTKEQREIYEIVLQANRRVIEEMKPGNNWRNLHLLAEKIILTGLQNLGIIYSEYDVDKMVNERVCYYFMPHGLGHLLGLQTHDAGGYLSFTPQRSPELGLKSLRSARDLVLNNIYTVEPGIYFNPYLLQKVSEDPRISKYINKSKYAEYKAVGGVRIEDNVVVTANGGDNLSSNMPRTVKEIENIMKK